MSSMTEQEYYRAKKQLNDLRARSTRELMGNADMTKMRELFKSVSEYEKAHID